MTSCWFGVGNDEYLYKWQIPLHIAPLPVMQGITHLSSLYIKWMTYVFYRNIIYILEIYMENNLISLLYETQCPVFDSDCSLSLSLPFSFSLWRTFVCLLLYAVSVWIVSGRVSLRWGCVSTRTLHRFMGPISNFSLCVFSCTFLFPPPPLPLFDTM